MDVYRIDAWKSILQGKNEFFPKVYSNAVVKPLLYMCLSVKEKMSEHDERESFFFFSTLNTQSVFTHVASNQQISCDKKKLFTKE